MCLLTDHLREIMPHHRPLPGRSHHQRTRGLDLGLGLVGEALLQVAFPVAHDVARALAGQAGQPGSEVQGEGQPD